MKTRRVGKLITGLIVAVALAACAGTRQKRAPASIDDTTLTTKVKAVST
ncbi:MAG: hypothetical protein IPH26_18370 [Sterolibacteriaceae bacterium]|uniref:Uncharacterized protein n=1 Tax=Candidatus Methylophosphatis roskildensis TaxID=2899263 RepID=A0A9D7E6B3_9PROT|nr:hypothetical protein [Candidatus Methylophosphatis roskildensis]